jgi:hypothetical protein
MFNLLDVHLILIRLDQFYSLSNLILILKFHKIILAPLLGASSTCLNTQAATIEIRIRGIRTRLFQTSGRNL